MGFILKTTFWLGLVYSAMPLGETGTALLSPAELASACTTASAAISTGIGSNDESYRALEELGCASLAIPAAPASRPRPAVAQTLTLRDRQPPWLGPPLPPARPRSG